MHDLSNCWLWHFCPLNLPCFFLKDSFTVTLHSPNDMHFAWPRFSTRGYRCPLQNGRNFHRSCQPTMHYNIMTSSNGNIFRVTGPLCGEFTGPGEFPTQRPVTRSFDVFFDLRLNKRLSKQPWGWWFETLSWSLWRHRNDLPRIQC